MASAEREPISESEGGAPGQVDEAPSYEAEIFYCVSDEAGKFAFLGIVQICAFGVI